MSIITDRLRANLSLEQQTLNHSKPQGTFYRKVLFSCIFSILSRDQITVFSEYLTTNFIQDIPQLLAKLSL